MTAISAFKPAARGEDVADIQKSAGNPIYQHVEIIWSEPELWKNDAPCPITADKNDNSGLYILTRDHHRQLERPIIKYIGLTTSFNNRFGKHPKAHDIIGKRGYAYISKAKLKFPNYWRVVDNNKSELEELEHILIWALYSNHILNEKKIWTLPGQGANGTRPWHIENTGHKFFGRMPLEIIFPWMLIRPRRDFTRKRK